MENISSSNSQKALVPKLRFPEFEGEWKESSFESQFEFLSNNTLSRAELGLSGDVLNIHYGDVLIKFGDTLDCKNSLIPFVLPTANLGRKVEFLKDGDCIIADTAEDETVGKATELYNIGSMKVVSGLHTIPCRPLQEYAHGYLGYYLNSHAFHSQLYSLMQGIKVLSISKSNINNTIIRYPTNSEQKKISTLLALLDRKIDAQGKLVDALKSYKRGVIKRIWTSESKSGWICDKICNLGNFHKGASLSKADISEEGLPMILYGELYTTYTEVISSVVRKTKAIVDDVYLSRVGDVIMPTSGETPEEISTASCVMQPGVILAGDLLIYRSSRVDGRIMSYSLNHIINDKIARIAQGKSIVHVQGREIGNIEITLPPLDLQIKYAEYLERLSQGIIAEEKCYELLFQLKSSLLQRIFI